MSAAAFVVAALPADVHARCSAIIGRVTSNGRGCTHLERRPTGFVCVMHPRLVHCLACAAAHIAAHNVVEEYHCDECGLRLDRPDSHHQLALAHIVEVDTTVSLGRGRRAAVGLVALFGWARCETCVTKVKR